MRKRKYEVKVLVRFYVEAEDETKAWITACNDIDIKTALEGPVCIIDTTLAEVRKLDENATPDSLI